MARNAPHRALLESLGLDASRPVPATSDGQRWMDGGAPREVRTPIDGSLLATVVDSKVDQVEAVVKACAAAFARWRLVPAPKRGEVVRLWGERLRAQKDALGRLVSLEMGKSLQEGFGEVQEMIDVCDFAVGLSRQLYGKTIASERAEHRMMEQWHPLGPVAVITAFNFPVAVYAWNAALALVCGDTVVWKPSEKTPLTAIAVQRMLMEVTTDAGHAGIAGLVCGDASVGQRLVEHRGIPLVSATGSCRMGYQVAETVARRLGRTLLELGGNNGVIVAPSADLALATRAVLFGAVGTAGQRCTSTRRVFVHEAVKDAFLRRLAAAYKQVRVGNPLEPENHMGPLIDARAVRAFEAAVAQSAKEGARLVFGGKTLPKVGPNYVEPTIVDASEPGFPRFQLAQEETFAPVLWVFSYRDLDEVVAWHNGVRQGLSSAIFTTDVREAERFLGPAGSDCGIANVNLGTSGAEIGGAFGGEKETGGGRESGSDSWKQYMRRQTATVNYGKDLPLAQGIRFDV